MSDEFNKERLMSSPDYSKVVEIIRLLIECRDALPAISEMNARIYGVKLDLADRIDECLKPWETTPDDPKGV